MDFQNTTSLDTDKLRDMIARATVDWPTHDLHVCVRYSRGAEFSGTCYYSKAQIYINLGRNNAYPYMMQTHIARAQSNKRQWWRELYSVEVGDAYQLVLFVFLHELYHWLVKKARRNVRQKEGRCDRFATRVLVDAYGAAVRDMQGNPPPRSQWDFQDLDGFVAAARQGMGRWQEKEIPVSGPELVAARQPSVPAVGTQLSLFEMP